MMESGTSSYPHRLVKPDGIYEEDGEIPNEHPLTLFVNGGELVTLMCTPVHVRALALGFLLNEGIIAGQSDVRAVTVCKPGGCVEVWLDYELPTAPRRRTITSGCAGGVTFEDLQAEHPPLKSTLTVTAARLRELMSAIYQASVIHKRAGGVHSAAVGRGDTGELRYAAEDVGRHNTLDKLRGLAFLDDADLRDGILLTTGRISSEMMNKARRMETPIVVSRTSPTNLSVTMAQAWDIMLVGYVRRDRLTVYTHPWRLESERET